MMRMLAGVVIGFLVGAAVVATADDFQYGFHSEFNTVTATPLSLSPVRNFIYAGGEKPDGSGAAIKMDEDGYVLCSDKAKP